MHYNKLLFLVFGIMIFQATARAQGCSDAGICTLDNIKPGSGLNSTAQLKAGVGYGNAEHGIRVVSPYLAYTRKFKAFSLETRLTSLMQSGSETTVFGLSDLFVVGNYGIKENFQVSAGLKIPLNDANRLLDGAALPMDYQSSLGTLDLLLGVLYKISKLELALAYQQPLTQNKNSFLTEDFPTQSDFRKFQSTNNYQRAGDALLRISYPISLGQRIRVTPSILSIYHLAEDSYIDSGLSEIPITGSQGLTLNMNLFANFSVSQSSNLEVNIGSPLIVRSARPDGLTRNFVMNLEYQINF